MVKRETVITYYVRYTTVYPATMPEREMRFSDLAEMLDTVSVINARLDVMVACYGFYETITEHVTETLR